MIYLQAFVLWRVGMTITYRFKRSLSLLVCSVGLLLSVYLAVIGYVVAPLLFDTLSDQEAGKLVGQLLHSANWVVLTGLLVLLVIKWIGYRGLHSLWMLVVAFMFTAISHFGLSPKMQSIKESVGYELVHSSAQWREFMMWHGLYQLLFLSLILLLVVWSIRNLNSLLDRT